MIVPDVNLLVYAYNCDAPRHSAAKKWWEDQMSGFREIGIPWVVAMGFLRLMTNPKVMERPMSALEALAGIRSWMERPMVRIIVPGPRHIEILNQFAEQRLLSSALITDSHIAAIVIEHNAELHSNDRDFHRFPGLRLRNPLDLSEPLRRLREG
jgi:toxin-antitoxin system PIN domain toxin